MVKMYWNTWSMMGLMVVMFIMCTMTGVDASTNAVATDMSRVEDDYQVLSEEAIQRLDEKATEISEEIGIQLAVVITDNMMGQSSENYANDYIDRYFPTEDSMVLLVNMEERELWIATAGSAITLYDGYIDTILDDIYYELQDDAFEEAIDVFIENAYYYYEENESRESLPATSSSNDSTYVTDTSTGSSQGGFTISVDFWMIFVALLFGGGITYWVTVSSRGKRTITARTYETGNSFVLNRSEDDYLRETTTRRRIPKNNSSSSGGSRGGGGGRSHGGGGRKF